MKKLALSALMMLSLLGSSQAANLYSSNLGNGLTLLGGTSPVTQGTIRFGVFPAGFDFSANSENFAAIDAAFTQVHEYTGPISVNATTGFFDLSATYSTTSSFEGVPYDSSAGTTTDTPGDIAGEKVYVWVLNNTNPAVATQQAIFSTSQRWADADDLVPDTFVNPDSGAVELAAHLGVLANGSNIGAGANSHTTGGALIPVSGVVATIAPNNTQFLVGTSVTFTATVTEGTPPLQYQWRRNGVNIPNATNSTYTIASVGLAGRGDYDCLVTNTANSDDSNDIFLNVVTAKPTITTPPAPAILPTGGTLNLAVDAVGAGTLNFSWKKGAVIPGAVTNMLSVPNLKLTDAGAYAVTVSNAPGAGTGSATATANVIIVDQTARTVVGQSTKMASLDAIVSGAGTLTYEWFLSTDLLNALEDGAKFAGSKTKKLTIKNLALTDSLGYVCRVSAGAAGSQTTGVQTLVVYNAAPTLGAVVFPPAIVGGFYSYQIPTTVLPDGSNMAETFAAAPLPAGLKLDVKTGVISGYPAKAGATAVKVAAINKVSKSETPAPFPSLVVNSFPANVAGSYVGPVERINELGADLGGRVELLISPTGVVSGKLIMGAATHTVAGPLTITGTDPLTAVVSASINVVRKGATPVVLSFDIAGNLLTHGNITDGTDNVSFNGWRNVWLLKPATADASDFAATYNIAIGLEEGDTNIGVATIPQGTGYAIAPVKLDGKVAFTGKFADGTSVTGSTFIGPGGEFFMFQLLYKNLGSFLAEGTIAKGADEALATDNSLTAEASWSAPVNNAANKLYKAGFNFELALAGGAYVAPTTVLGLAENDTADLSFEQANIGGGQNPDTTVTILAANKFTVAAVPAKTALTFTAKSGMFSGSFESVAKKKTSFFGLIVPIQGELKGGGYFLLDQAGTPATQQSGAVFFEETQP